MAEQMTETTTGRTGEAGPTHTTIIERRSGGSGWVIGLALILALVVAAILGSQYLQQQQVETNAISGAAESVGDAADSVGAAADKAGDAIDNATPGE